MTEPQTNDPASDDYIPPWRKAMPEPLNNHLTQLRPRRDERPAVLDEMAEAERQRRSKNPRSNIIR